MAVGFLSELKTAPPAHDAARAAATLAELARLAEAGATGAAAFLDDAGGHALLTGAAGNSPYLGRLLAREVSLLGELAARPADAVLADLLAATERMPFEVSGQAAQMAPLRAAKRRLALLAALADLGGAWPLATVTAALSDFAAAALQASVRRLLLDAAGRGDLVPADPARPEAGSALVVLGMGKLGARELNYSSDVDLAVFYDRDASPYTGDAVERFYIRLTQGMVKLMQEITADGYVFRTDLRLRPDPNATPAAVSLAAAEQYYESAGQNWERAAMIKARPVAGDLALGADFVASLQPFVWRRNLDFAAIADVHSIKRQIHSHRGHGDVAVLGHNIKVGRGGIRDIEFFAQTQQLIAGGRDPALRVSTTCGALDALAERHWIEPAVAAELKDVYAFHRTLEHRLQMVADEQTQTLPKDEAGLDRIARFMGHADTERFRAELVANLETVQRHYHHLFEEAPSLGDAGNLSFTGTDDDPDTLATLAGLGFAEPRAISQTVRGWHHGRYRAVRSARAREMLTELTPALLRGLAETADPDGAFLRFDRFLRGLPAGVQLFSMLTAQPGLLKLLVQIVGGAPGLSDHLAEHSAVLDAVLSEDFYAPLPPREEMVKSLNGALRLARDYQDALDVTRRFVKERKFQLGVHLLRGLARAADVGRAYADLADSAILGLLPLVEAEMAERHGRFDGGRMAVIALGKLGGQEMSATSDLDLMFVYEYPEPDATSDGPRPLTPGHYYARLSQRLINALTVPTAAGPLYEVDMRLRPSGNKGPVAVSLERLRQYHAEEAWTWEHMALTRARVVTAPDDLKDKVEAVIRDVLTRPRDPVAIAADVADMRARIAREKGTANPWELKQVPGGLIDVEFAAQYLQLVHAAAHPGILHNNTGEALRALGEAGVLPADAADDLVAAYRLASNLTGVLRVAVQGAPDPATAPPALRAALAEAADVADFETLQALLPQRLAAAHARFEALVAPPAS